MSICRHCGRSFKHDAALNDHLWEKHPAVKRPPPKCVICRGPLYRGDFEWKGGNRRHDGAGNREYCLHRLQERHNIFDPLRVNITIPAELDMDTFLGVVAFAILVAWYLNSDWQWPWWPVA